MNLLTTVALLRAGGPGSGCHGDNCGRPGGGGGTAAVQSPKSHSQFAREASEYAMQLPEEHPSYREAHSKAKEAHERAADNNFGKRLVLEKRLKGKKSEFISPAEKDMRKQQRVFKERQAEHENSARDHQDALDHYADVNTKPAVRIPVRRV